MHPYITIEIQGQTLTLASFNFCMGLGLVFGFLLLDRLLRNNLTDRGKRDTVFHACVLGLLGGFACAWLSDALLLGRGLSEAWFSMSSGISGLTFLGGLAGGGIVAVTYLKVKGIGGIAALNIVVPALTLGHAFGRIGCFMAGCCYGKMATVAGHQFRIPTQLMESAGLFLLTAVLLRAKPDNRLILYLTGYGVLRFVIEFLRADARGPSLFGLLSPSQVMCLGMVAIALALQIFRKQLQLRTA